MAWLISKAQWFWQHNADLNFGWIVVLLCAYVFWDAWEKRPPIRLRWTIFNTLVGLGALSLLFVNQIYQAAFGLNAASMVGLALACLLATAANVHYVFGFPGIRRFGFAFAFILIAMPMPSIVQGLIVSRLQSIIATINVDLLNLLGISARQVGSLIQLSNGTVGIDEACSGIRSLQSTVMATLFIGHLSFRSKGLQFVLFVGGICLAVLGNVIRSFYLSYTAHFHGIDAVKNAHDTAGWSILAFTAVGVILLAWALARAEAQAAELAKRPPAPTEAHTNPRQGATEDDGLAQKLTKETRP